MYNSQGLAVTWIMVSCVMMQGSQYRPTKIPLESVRALYRSMRSLERKYWILIVNYVCQLTSVE